MSWSRRSAPLCVLRSIRRAHQASWGSRRLLASVIVIAIFLLGVFAPNLRPTVSYGQTSEESHGHAHQAPAAPWRPGDMPTTITVLGVAVNHSSAKIYFTPVPGAKDYRAFDVAQPNVVKYAGVRHYETLGNFTFQTVNNDGVDPIVPLQVQSGTGAGAKTEPPQSPLRALNDYPYPMIEWNTLGDHQPHQLVIEALDQLGPTVPEATYDLQTFTPTVADSRMLGMNDGPTLDGKRSTNGQGPTSNHPQPIAQSAPFMVQADPSVRAIPSGPEATQIFFDTFDQAEAATLRQASESPVGIDPPAGARKTYTLNDGDPDKGWTIEYQAADRTRAFPFVANDHFMDILADEAPGASWAVMNMRPQRVVDISGGQVLHLTQEVDSSMDFSGRRWLGFDFSPAEDPITSWNTGNLNLAPLNMTQQVFFVEISATQVRYRLFSGVGPTVGSPHEGDLKAFNTQRYLHHHYDGLGWDNRSRFDAFLSQTHFALFEDGQLVSDFELPNGGLPYSKLVVGFAHYMYHSSAILVEEPNVAPWNSYAYKVFPHTDERHWDNMGFEVLPGSYAPTSPAALSALGERVQPPVAAPYLACPDGWQCSVIGNGPGQLPSFTVVEGATWNVRSGGILADDPDRAYFVGRSVGGDTSLSARLLSHANLSYWGVSGRAGLMVRDSLDPKAPFYLVAYEPDGMLHIVSRPAPGAAIADAATTVAARLPMYLRVARSGNTFAALTSADGASWSPLRGSSQTVSMSGEALVGLVDWELQVKTNGFFPQIGSAVFDSVAIGATAPADVAPLESGPSAAGEAQAGSAPPRVGTAPVRAPAIPAGAPASLPGLPAAPPRSPAEPIDARESGN